MEALVNLRVSVKDCVNACVAVNVVVYVVVWTNEVRKPIPAVRIMALMMVCLMFME